MSTSAQQTPHEAEIGSMRKSGRLGKFVWALFALFIAFLATGANLPANSHLGIFRLLLIWLGGAALGYLGVRLGDGVARIARPDVIVTTGGVQGMLWARIGWAIGPQVVGIFLGSVAGTSILSGWIA